MSTVLAESIPEPIDLAAKMQELQKSYPAYYRAWKSMISTYGVQSITPEWRGTFGLMRFIEDTSTLPNNPTELPDTPVKFKRKFPHMAFELSNVYWKLPARVQKQMYLAGLPRPQGKSILPAISTFAAMTPQEQETALDELIQLQLDGKELTPQQQHEMEILAALIAGQNVSTLEPAPKISKYEDI